MKWSKVITKGLLGIATFVIAYLATNPSVITNLIPENVVTMSVGGVVAGLLVAISNWLKNRKVA